LISIKIKNKSNKNPPCQITMEITMRKILINVHTYKFKINYRRIKNKKLQKIINKNLKTSRKNQKEDAPS